MHAWVHHDVVLLDDSNAMMWVLPLFASTHWASVILLGLDHVTTKHLWVLDLDLRIIEDIIVVIIYILNDLNRLVLTLLLWFG